MSNKAQFKKLLKKAGITQGRAAELIAEQTMRPCAARTVRAWLADDEATSARPCPDWAISALTSKLVELELIAAPAKRNKKPR